MIKQIVIITLSVYFTLCSSSIAGTFRDDFENEKDFLKDKQDRVATPWGEDIGSYSWEKGSVKGTNLGSNTCYLLITGDYKWEDYTVECKVNLIRSDNGVGMVIRRPCIDCNSGYWFGLSVANRATITYSNGILASSQFEVKLDTWYSFKAIAQGEKLEFYIDGKQIAEAKDGTYAAGKAGFFACNNCIALFDDFVMTGPEVKDGGHWNPKAHSQIDVNTKDKLTATWGRIKSN
jgi:hypothetical protein